MKTLILLLTLSPLFIFSQTQPKELKSKLEHLQRSYDPAAAATFKSGYDHFFPQPGIIASSQGGSWEGAEHLYNITNNIGIYVEVISTKDMRAPPDQKRIKDTITSLFEKVKINPSSESSPPFPFFHMLVMIAPVENGYAIFCEGRLFESVTLQRFALARESFFQAITWEKQALFIAPSNELDLYIEKGVREITDLFVEKYKYYDDLLHRR